MKTTAAQRERERENVWRQQRRWDKVFHQLLSLMCVACHKCLQEAGQASDVNGLKWEFKVCERARETERERVVQPTTTTSFCGLVERLFHLRQPTADNLSADLGVWKPIFVHTFFFLVILRPQWEFWFSFF